MTLGDVAILGCVDVEVVDCFEEVNEDFLQDPHIEEEDETTEEREQAKEDFIANIKIAHFLFIIN